MACYIIFRATGTRSLVGSWLGQVRVQVSGPIRPTRRLACDSPHPPRHH